MNFKNTLEQKLQLSAHYVGDPWKPTNEYFSKAEKGIQYCWDKLIWPFIYDCTFDNVLDLAAGHGRNSDILRHFSKNLIIQDIQPGNIERCIARFNGINSISYLVGNGYDLHELPSESISLVYCFDAMVHFNPDVVESYLSETARVLKPGGRGFFHHSNFTGGVDWKKNPAGRNYMSASLFQSISTKNDLLVIRQKVINWNSHVDLDCLTVVEKRGMNDTGRQ